MTEEWRPVVGYESLYEVSNLGNVRSNKRHIEMKAHMVKKGYLRITLCDGSGTKRNMRVHRMVASAFIPNPNNLPQINHLNGDKKDNCVGNLEWADNSMNMLHAYRMGLMPRTRRKRPMAYV